MLKLTRWTIAHRRIVVVSWIVLAIGVLAVSQAVGTRNANNFSLPNTDSQRAADLLQGRFPAQAGDADQIVFRARTGKLTDASTRAAIPPVLVRIARLPHVAGVVSPYAAGANGISKTSTIGFATVAFDQRANELPKAAIDRVINTAETMRSPTLQVELGGQAIKQAQHKYRLRYRGRAHRRHRRAAAQLRLAARDGPADRDGTVRPRRRPGRDRAREPPRRHGRLLLGASTDDRPRRRHRLRPLHRHALSRRLPPERRRRPGCARAGDEHGRQSDPLRRRHGRDRPARHVRARRQLPLRRRDRRVPRRAARARRLAHAAPRVADVHGQADRPRTPRLTPT